MTDPITDIIAEVERLDAIATPSDRWETDYMEWREDGAHHRAAVGPTHVEESRPYTVADFPERAADRPSCAPVASGGPPMIWLRHYLTHRPEVWRDTAGRVLFGAWRCPC